MRKSDVIEIVPVLVDLFISNKKMAHAVINKLRVQLGASVIPEYNDIGQYHWGIAQIKLKNDLFIGYMPNLMYYDDIIELDIDALEIKSIPINHTKFYREPNKLKTFKILNRCIADAREILINLKAKHADL